MENLDFKTINDKLLSFDNVLADEKILDGYIAYRRTDLENKNERESVFAIIKTGSKPVLLDLACDRNLSKKLREEYETISPSKIVDPARWIQVICSGQVEADYIKDLIVLAYNLIASN